MPILPYALALEARVPLPKVAPAALVAAAAPAPAGSATVTDPGGLAEPDGPLDPDGPVEPVEPCDDGDRGVIIPPPPTRWPIADTFCGAATAV